MKTMKTLINYSSPTDNISCLDNLASELTSLGAGAATIEDKLTQQQLNHTLHLGRNGSAHVYMSSDHE